MTLWYQALRPCDCQAAQIVHNVGALEWLPWSRSLRQRPRPENEIGRLLIAQPRHAVENTLDFHRIAWLFEDVKEYIDQLIEVNNWFTNTIRAQMWNVHRVEMNRRKFSGFPPNRGDGLVNPRQAGPFLVQLRGSVQKLFFR